MLCLKLGVRAFGWFFLLACGKGNLCRATQQIIQGGLGLGLGGLGLGGSQLQVSLIIVFMVQQALSITCWLDTPL